LARVVAVRQVVGREGVRERGVDALGVEDVQQLDVPAPSEAVMAIR